MPPPPFTAELVDTPGNDTETGTSDNERLIIIDDGGRTDTFDGGQGNDTIDLTLLPIQEYILDSRSPFGTFSGVSIVNLGLGTVYSVPSGTTNISNFESVIGTEGADLIIGDDEANYIDAGGASGGYSLTNAFFGARTGNFREAFNGDEVVDGGGVDTITASGLVLVRLSADGVSEVSIAATQTGFSQSGIDLSLATSGVIADLSAQGTSGLVISGGGLGDQDGTSVNGFGVLGGSDYDDILNVGDDGFIYDGAGADTISSSGAFAEFDLAADGVSETSIRATTGDARLELGFATSGVTVDLSAQGVAGTMVISGGGLGDQDGATVSGINAVSGSRFDDVITGDDTGNILTGGNGGFDTISGGAGSDVIALSSGIAYGGASGDEFELTLDSPSMATILDFEVGDKIRYFAIDTTFLGESAFTMTANEFRIVKESGETRLEQDIDGDGFADSSVTFSNGELDLFVAEEDFGFGFSEFTISVGGPANAGPMFATSSTTVSVAENSQLIGVFQAVDPEDDPITYNLLGEDADLFELDANAQLSFINAPDFESLAGNTSFDVIISANSVDEFGLSQGELQFVTVSVFDVDESTGRNNVITVQPDTQIVELANDGPDAGGLDTVSGTADDLNGLLVTNFEAGDNLLVEGTGAVELVGVRQGSVLLDFSTDGDPSTVEFTVSIEGSLANSEEGILPEITDFAIESEGSDTRITLLEPTGPTITSASAADAAENQTLAIDVEASDDVDSEGAGLSYAITGGTDADLFSIDTNTGVVSFLSAPDFEAPSDADGNNVFDVQVTATDSRGLTDVQDLAITVTDVNDTPSPSSDLIVNGDFEDNPVQGDGYGFFDNIPGWTATLGQLEIQSGDAPNQTDMNVTGNDVLELASSQNAGIQQTVTVAEGEEGIYRLSLDYAERRDDQATARFNVIVDGEIVDTVTAEAAGTTQAYELDLPLTAGNHTIGFTEIGQNDGRGSILDNISLIATGEPLPGTDPVPQDITLSLADTSIAEDGSTLATITRTGDIGIDAPLTVTVTVSGGDEAEPTTTEVAFAANQMSQTVQINGLTDGVVDGDQAVTVTATSGALSDTANLTVTDIDTPPPPPPGSDLIVNGDFEDNPVQGDGYGFFDNIPGWTATLGQLEIQSGDAPNQTDMNVTGNDVLELASSQNAGIQQTVTVAEGEEGIYRLSLDYAERRDDQATARFNVIVDGEIVDTVTAEAAGTTQTYELDLPLTAGNHTIGFTEIGQNDGRGSILDNISLIATGEPLPGTDPVPQDITLSLADTSIAEDGSTLATITRTGDIGIDAPLTVTVTVSGSDEAEPVTTDITFAANQTSQTVQINGLTDGVVDGDQAVTVTATSGALSDTASLTVTDIDTPAPPPPGSDLIINGDFEDSPVLGDGYGFFDNIPGWTSTLGQLEIQSGAAPTQTDLNTSGNAVVELASSQNAGIQQTVTVADGEDGIYRLSLDYAERRDDQATARFNVIVDGEIVDTVTAEAAGTTQTYELDLPLTAGNHTIGFTEIGQNDGRGSILDNISLIATGEPLPEPDPQELTIRLADASIAEDGSTFATITRTGDTALDSPLTVTITISGSDEAEPVITEYTFAPRQAGHTIQINGLTDGVVDGDQAVTVTVTSGSLSADASLTVTDIDIAPPPPPPGSDLIVNGDFEDNPVQGDGYGFFDNIPGWTATLGQLEIQSGATSVSDIGAPGNSVAELASDTNSAIQQTVTVAEGEEGIYRLSLDHAERTDDSFGASFQVIVDGTIITTVSPTTPGVTEAFEIDLALTEGQHTIEFAQLGQNDGKGSLIDNVSLISTGDPLPPPPPADTLSFDGTGEGRIVNLAEGSWAAPLRVLPLGDSITHGIRLGPIDNNDTTIAGYRDDLWDSFVDNGVLIDYVGSRANGPTTLLDQSHEGTPGIRADQIADALPSQINSFRPDIVLLMAGTNDSRQDPNNSGTTTPQDIERIINTILNEDSDTQIYVATLPPQDPALPRNVAATDALNQANQGIVDLVARLNSEGLTNIHLVRTDDFSLDLISDVGPDGQNDNGLHPTNEGYAELASRWFDAILSSFNDEGVPVTGPQTDISPLVENVIGSSGNDYLIGDNRDNILEGRNGSDILDGGAGNDVLTGGNDADIFIFSQGTDTITDFTAGTDLIDLSGSGITSFSAFMDNAFEQGGDVVFTDDDTGASSTRLADVNLEDLSDDMFIFDDGLLV